MTGLKIIILSVVALSVYVLPILSLWKESKQSNTMKLSFEWWLLFTLLWALLTAIAIGMTIEYHNIVSGCPEYEKIENVYRLKK